MPATLSYPGVYIEEISSGVHTITGVATSITAFIGRTRRGPVADPITGGEPITINSFADFERIFGGLWELSPLSFAVRDFYLNGGSQAVIVRLYTPFFADDAARDAALLIATNAAQTAATAVSAAAAAAVAPNVTPAAVTDAADAAVLALVTPSPAALAAAQQVAAAARAEAIRPPYMTTAQRMDISNATTATTGDINLEFRGVKTAATIGFAVLKGAKGAAEAAVEGALEGLTTIGTNNIVSVTRSLTAPNVAPNFSFEIVFTATPLATPPQDLIMVRDSTLADAPGNPTPTITVSFPLPDAQSVANAASAAATGPGVATAAEAATPPSRARLPVGTLELEAANPGSWGSQLRARIDHDVAGPGAATLFNLSVRDGGTGAGEVFRSVSVDPNHKRNVMRVLERESKLVRTRGALPLTRPNPNAPAPLGVVPMGGDPFSSANSSGVTAAQSDDGQDLVGADYTSSAGAKTGIYALEKTDLFNILCLPPYSFTQDVEASTWAAAADYCEGRRAMLMVDAPADWNSKDAAKGNGTTTGIAGLGTNTKNGAVFFPRLQQPNPLRDNQVETFAPCGAVAGVFARTDTQRGVWKAPAGLEATLVGVPQLSVPLTDAENGELNPLGINCLRAMPAAGRVVWGSRTLQGDDRLASEWKYVPVRRLALFLEESLFRGTKWVVFEPNDEPLWAQIRLNLGAFMHNLFRQGAFQGVTPKDAYFVKCDKETTTQADINLGIVNILVGFAPLKPAEFVVIKIQQMAGQIET